MAIVLYSNGILEQYQPANLVFTEEELLKSFGNYKNIRSKRLVVIPNVWCLWGEMENAEPVEFNRLCTDIIETHIFSHVIFVHDSELNPSWQMTDMLYKSYIEFRKELNEYIDQVAKRIVEESERISQEKGIADNLILLQTAGQTDDKKVIYTFNPQEQSADFYKNGSFANFSERIIDYWMNNKYYGDETQIVIFEDKKVIITVLKENVENLFSRLIKTFETNENYEMCSVLTQIQKNYSKILEKKKRGRPRKNNKAEQ